MRWERLGLAGFTAAAVIAGAWVVTDAPPATQTVPVETLPAPPAAGPQGSTADPAAPATALSGDDLIKQMVDSLTGRPMCDAPPVELTEEMARAIEKALSTLPLPPTVPPDTAGAVIDIHRPVAPC